MAKPDPALLDPARYPFTCRIDPRFGDLDLNKHINNVAMAGILEDARVRFHYASGYRDALAGLRSVMASVSIDYLGEGSYPDPLDIHVAIERQGRSSHTLVQVARQGGRLLAFARTVQVTVDKQGPVELPAHFVAAMSEWTIRA
jgi:acyl-CoA thioester hydrolase